MKVQGASHPQLPVPSCSSDFEVQSAESRYLDIARPGHCWSTADFDQSPRDRLLDPTGSLVVEASGFVATRNAMGYMTSCLDPYSAAFTRYAGDFPYHGKPCLDIGAAFGVASLQALHYGARVVANDLDSSHLETLRLLAPEHVRPRLTLDCQPFPGDMDYEENHFSAILASRVLHFLTVPQLLVGAAKVARWLAPGGYLFVVEDTPYLGNSSGFIDLYERRVQAGEPFPGMCLHVDKTRTTRASAMPDFFHFFDVRTLARVFEEAGLDVINCRTFPRLDYPQDVQLDGREGVGLIATKR